MTGEFIAVDADSGKTLWQFQTGSGVNAQPVTFTHNGRQFVTVLSGSAASIVTKRAAS
jgi:alcohol dehydrogenase (cytochrome c)